MKNYQVAEVFRNIADLMEIEGESPFKIGAYRRAADTFSSLTDNIEELARRGQLLEIPGVGQAIEAKTRQILETGTCDLYERLKEQFPITILELFGVPGVGAKTIRSLHETLNIASLQELRQAAETGAIRAAPRMGARLEQRILEGIRRIEARASGVPILRALPLTEGLAQQVSRLSTVDEAWPAGAPRRFAEIAARISLAVAATHPGRAMDDVEQLFSPGSVRSRDEHQLVVESEPGEIVFYVDEPPFAGAALVRATGSDAHLEALQSVARKRGIAFDTTRLVNPGGEPIRTPAEADFYDALGLPFIPPEMREDTGEMEAAASGGLPRLVTVEDLIGDLHSHTVDSDGGSTAEEMARAAMERGYRYLAVTDHSQSLTIARGLGAERLRQQGVLLAEVNKALAGRFRLLRGIEVDIKADGTLDLDDDVLADLEFVVCSIHSLFGMPGDQMTARAVRAVSSPYVNVMAHPTGRIIGMRDPYDIEIARVIEAAAENGTALEINSFLERLDLNASDARAAKEAGVKICVSTDAHNTDDIGKIAYGIGMARRAWLTRDDVLNAMPLEALSDWTMAKRRT